ncbi:MAG TPA: hypothetical protein VLU46_09150 [Thermoanaerobaculia bacterium]|nr:hypothetical protein [Thermoanaerobaculia bacterium]
MSSVSGLEHEVAKARADVRADFEALGREFGRDERQAKARLREYGPLLIAGAAGLGLLLGFGGPKWIKRVLIGGAVAGAAAFFIRRNM